MPWLALALVLAPAQGLGQAQALAFGKVPALPLKLGMLRYFVWAQSQVATLPQGLAPPLPQVQHLLQV